MQAVTKVSGPSEEDSPWVMRRSDSSTDSLVRNYWFIGVLYCRLSLERAPQGYPGDGVTYRVLGH